MCLLRTVCVPLTKRHAPLLQLSSKGFRIHLAPASPTRLNTGPLCSLLQTSLMPLWSGKSSNSHFSWGLATALPLQLLFPSHSRVHSLSNHQRRCVAPLSNLLLSHLGDDLCPYSVLPSLRLFHTHSHTSDTHATLMSLNNRGQFMGQQGSCFPAGSMPFPLSALHNLQQMMW